jgi:hypothetical protein
MWESLTTVNLKESKPEGRLGTLATRRVYTEPLQSALIWSTYQIYDSQKLQDQHPLPPNLMKKCHMKIRHIQFVISDRGSSSINNSEKSPSVSSTTSNPSGTQIPTGEEKKQVNKFLQYYKNAKNQCPKKTPLTPKKKLTNNTSAQLWFASGQLGLSRKHLYHFLDLTLLEITLAQLPQLDSIRKASLQHRSGPPFSAYILFPLEECQTYVEQG